MFQTIFCVCVGGRCDEAEFEGSVSEGHAGLQQDSAQRMGITVAWTDRTRSLSDTLDH